MRVSIIGTGYVGLVSGACLAAKGHQVTCVDINPETVDRINRAEPPIHEEGLQELLDATGGKSLVATTDLHGAVMSSELSLIAVGTPFDGDQIDLRFIREVSRQIGECLREKDDYHLVVVKSTVVPGTTLNVVAPIVAEASGKTLREGFGAAMNPEFLREGNAIEDFMNPDRIVYGGTDPRAIEILDELYSVFPDVDIVRTEPNTAEMIKYTANSLLATLISFSNEIGNLCQTVGVDSQHVMNGVHLDKRFMPIRKDGERIRPDFISYLAAGCGFGGSCFPKDVKALIAYADNAGQDMAMLKSVIDINKAQPQRMLDMLRHHYPDLRGVKVTVLGVAFKPGTDDVRESPALPIISALLEAGAETTAYDPIAADAATKLFGLSLNLANTLEDAVSGADAILLVTGWESFKALPQLLRRQEQAPLLVDGRRLIASNAVERYEGIGLPPTSHRATI